MHPHENWGGATKYYHFMIYWPKLYRRWSCLPIDSQEEILEVIEFSNIDVTTKILLYLIFLAGGSAREDFETRGLQPTIPQHIFFILLWKFFHTDKCVFRQSHKFEFNYNSREGSSFKLWMTIISVLCNLSENLSHTPNYPSLLILLSNFMFLK